MKNSLPELQSKEKESSPSYIGVDSSRVSSEVDYTTTIYPKPTSYEWTNTVNAENIPLWMNRGNCFLKVVNKRI